MSKAAKRRQQVAWGKRMRVTRVFAQHQVIGFCHPAAERKAWRALFTVDEAKTAKDAKSRAIRFRLGYLRGAGCRFPRRLRLRDGILGLLPGSCYSPCNAPGYLLPSLRDYWVTLCRLFAPQNLDRKGACTQPDRDHNFLSSPQLPTNLRNGHPASRIQHPASSI